jgi:hypothetical protein
MNSNTINTIGRRLRLGVVLIALNAIPANPATIPIAQSAGIVSDIEPRPFSSLLLGSGLVGLGLWRRRKHATDRGARQLRNRGALP